MPFVADLRTVLQRRDFRRLFTVRLGSQGAVDAFQAAADRTTVASIVMF